MHMTIQYTNGKIKTYDGDYEIHDNYINMKILITHHETFSWYELIIPLHVIEVFEGHP